MNSSEFKSVLIDLGKRDVTEDQVKEMLAQVDRNNDNQIQWDEFVEVFFIKIRVIRCSEDSRVQTKICSNKFLHLSSGKIYIFQIL